MRKSASLLQVAVGILIDADRRLFITRRAADQHQGGLWEFPGGKLEAHETARQALDRELYEEINIHIIDAQPFIQVTHDYGDIHVLLHVFMVTEYAGKPIGAEGQDSCWVAISSLVCSHSIYAFPAANQPILDKLLAIGRSV